MSTAADICRERGWGKGTLIVERAATDWGGWEETVFRVTAIGEEAILAIALGGRTSRFPKWHTVDESEIIVDELEEVTPIDRLPWEVPDADGL